MYIPRDLIMIVIGSILTFIIAYLFESKHPEEKKETKENWVKKGWRNAKRDWKKRFKKKKKKEGENTYRKKIEREQLHKTIEGLVE